MRLQKFDAPKIIFTFIAFWPLYGYTATHGIMASLVGTRNVWDTFLIPSFILWWAVLILKSAAQSLVMLPNCSVDPGQSHATKVSRLPACRIRTMTSSVYHLLSLPALPWDSDGEMRYGKNLCGEAFEVEDPLHYGSPTLSASEGGVQWYEDSSWLETSLAAGDDHDILSTLPHPVLSTKHCRTTPLAIEILLNVSSAQSARTNFAC